VTSKQWSRVAPIVHSALMRDEPARAVFVAGACGDDTDLRREVDSLLARASEVDDFLNGAAADLIGAADRGLVVGDRIGPYAIECRLGAGGMGEVYRARDGKLDRDVAIKILPQAISADATRVARFEREARILATLNHPRIGAIYGLEYLDGLPALILELVDGPTLAERLHGAPLSVSEAVAVAIAVAEALEAAHARGIIHRDIKPANIKLTCSSVKVLDFGLAKDVGGHDEDLSIAGTGVARADNDLSTPGSLMGTVAYMSPEQAGGEALDARTDLFSLGAVLYEMTTGRQPFVGADPSGIIKAIVHEPPPSPRAVNPSVPRALERVILGLLERRRESRYQTASEVRAALASVAAGLDASGTTESRQTRRSGIVVGLIATAVTLLGASMWLRLPNRAPLRSEYTQVTHFADSATSPALSPDGRLLAFVRGSSTFEGPGQIYVKELPGGDPVQLTSDRFGKMGPIFSPDGSRIAYTSVSNDFGWDTWVVPISSRVPRFWLRNASGLTWIGDRDVLFSELAIGFHMHVVSANDNREAVRVVYNPAGEQGMAHRSYRSPDGAWALIVEMVRPVWQPCRLVAMDGRTSRRVGPEGQCTSAAWSPDGKWMYFSSNGSGSFHIWRQRFPEGTPEQVSFGPGEEEGIAVSPDGRSLLTSVGNRQSSIWVGDTSGEREVSKEGYAFIPAIPNSGMSQPFSVNGRLLYLIRQGAVRFAGPDGERAGELWQTDLQTSQSEALFPGVQVSGYDVSRDGSQIVFAALDDRGTSHIWLGRTDRRTAPRQLPPRGADSPHFGSRGRIYYRSSESGASLIYRMDAGGDTTQALARPVAFFMSVSPDDAWLVARVEAAPGAESSQENVAFPTTPGRLPVRLCGGATCEVDWTPNGKSLVVRLGNTGSAVVGRTFVIGLRPGETLPRLPPRGITSEADLVGLRILQAADRAVYPADVAPLIAFVRSTTERNIYRIPLP
jgi:serine/threonine protein kinase